MKGSNALSIALEVLSMPEGPTNKELQKMARSYLRELSDDDYYALKDEALTSKSVADEAATEDLQDYKYKLFKQMGFSDIEANAYCRCRLNSPGIRRVVARRALLIKLVGSLPKRVTHFQLMRMEDSRGLTHLSHDEVLAKLLGGEVRARGR